jgi:hypothetical protein
MKAMGECRASLEQTIKIWRENLGIIQGVNGPKALVIGDEDEEIRFSGRWSPACD